MSEATNITGPARYKNVDSYLDRHGQRRWRYRKQGRVFQLGTEFESPEFFKRLELARIGKSHKGQSSKKQRLAAGTAGKTSTKQSCTTSKENGYNRAPIAAQRRRTATPSRVDEIIANGQRRGLNPTTIILHADGSTEVRYSETGQQTEKVPLGIGWEDI